MKRKLVSVLLSSLMIVGLMAGCGGDKNSDSDTGATSGTGSEVAATGAADQVSHEEEYNVVMQWPAVGDDPTGLADVEAAVNKITKEKLNVTVTLEPVNAFNLATETSLAVSSGEKLDLSLSLFTGLGGVVNTGTVIEMDDLIDKYGSAIKETCGNQLAGGYYDNKLYGVPAAYIDANDVAFVANKEILDKYNITIDPNKVYTIEELEAIFATVKAGEGDKFYILGGGYTQDLPIGALYDFEFLGAGCGLLYQNNDFSNTDIKNLYATDEFKTYAEKMYDWAQKGYFSPDAATTTETAASQMASGLCLGTFALNSGLTAADYGQQSGKECVVITTNEAVRNTAGYTSVLWSIPTTSDDPERTMEFLNLLYEDPELDNLLQYGIEGVSYNVVESDENGTVIQIPEGQNAMTVPYWQQFGVYGNRLSWNVVAPNTTDTNNKLREFSQNVKYTSPALGFVFNETAVQTEVSAVQAVISQYKAILNTGAIDPTKELPEFTKALESAGIDKVLTEMQSQFADWKAQQK